MYDLIHFYDVRGPEFILMKFFQISQSLSQLLDPFEHRFTSNFS